jgi:hypothetical protein
MKPQKYNLTLTEREASLLVALLEPMRHSIKQANVIMSALGDQAGNGLAYHNTHRNLLSITRKAEQALAYPAPRMDPRFEEIVGGALTRAYDEGPLRGLIEDQADVEQFMLACESWAAEFAAEDEGSLDYFNRYIAGDR